MRALGLDIGGSSVKAALLVDDEAVATGRSDRYSSPDRAALESAMASAARAALGDRREVDRVGLCVPGVLHRDRLEVVLAINVPGIQGVPLARLVGRALGSCGVVTPRDGTPPLVTSDAHATAHDLWQTERLGGRLLCLALGTGVGAAVLDDGVPLRVSGETPGHLGHIDVALDDDPPQGADGARGTLESYIGLRALERAGAIGAAAGVDPEFEPDALEPALRALARALRVCHAIYRPHHVRLAGGVGIRLRDHLPGLRERVAVGLTSLARDPWTLGCGSSDAHAALGAARLAASV